MVWTPVSPCQISEGAQIVQLAYFHVNLPGSFLQVRGNSGFDFTRQSQIFWAQSLSIQRPTLKCSLWHQKEKLQIAGILDSGADCTVIAFSAWTSHWPLTQAAKGLAGVGGLSIPKQSVKFVTIEGLEGCTTTVKPYVLSLPVTLWGRDCLRQWGHVLGTNLS